jgi:IS5 family transposase
MVEIADGLDVATAQAAIEKIFGTWKRCDGLRRMRWRGLARAGAQVHFTATAYNLKPLCGKQGAVRSVPRPTGHW